MAQSWAPKSCLRNVSGQSRSENETLDLRPPAPRHPPLLRRCSRRGPARFDLHPEAHTPGAWGGSGSTELRAPEQGSPRAPSPKCLGSFCRLRADSTASACGSGPPLRPQEFCCLPPDPGPRTPAGEAGVGGCQHVKCVCKRQTNCCSLLEVWMKDFGKPRNYRVPGFLGYFFSSSTFRNMM